jgi:phage antirepressor YoqD-like protein
MLEALSQSQKPNLDSNEYQVITAENKMTSEILLNERLCLCLASGYDINLRMNIIDDWAEMKAEKKELSRKELALMIIQAEEEKEQLQLAIENQNKEIERMKPRDEFVSKFFQANDLLKVSEVAKCLSIDGVGRNNLYLILRTDGVLCANNEPKQQFINQGYFSVKFEFVEQINGYRPTTYVTKKGFGWLCKKFNLINTNTNQLTLNN